MLAVLLPLFRSAEDEVKTLNLVSEFFKFVGHELIKAFF